MPTETEVVNDAFSRIGVKAITDIDSDTSARAVLAAARYDQIRDEVLRLDHWSRLRVREELSAAVITGITQADPAVVTTSAAHGFAVGEWIVHSDVVGMTEINTTVYKIGAVTATTYDLTTTADVDLDSTGFTAYSSGGEAKLRPRSGYDQMFPLPSDCLRVLDVYDTTYPWVIEGNRILCDDGEPLKIRYLKQDTDPDNYDSLLLSVLAAKLAWRLAPRLTRLSNAKKAELERDYQRALMEARDADGMEQSPMEQQEDSWVQARF